MLDGARHAFMPIGSAEPTERAHSEQPPQIDNVTQALAQGRD